MLRFFSRRPRTVKVPLESGVVEIQKVEVKKKSKPVFQFLVRLAVAYCVVRTIWWLRSDEFKKLRTSTQTQNGITQTRKNQTGSSSVLLRDRSTTKSNATAQAGGVQKSLVHLTVPVWFREKERELFKSSDPQWEAVKDLQKDEKRCMELKKKLVKDVASLVTTTEHRRSLEFVQFGNRVGGHFDFIPPLWAPRVYEVPCISVGQDWGIQFGWRPIPRAASAKTERMFHPIVFSQAFMAGCLAFSTSTYKITVAKVLDGYYGPDPQEVKIAMVPRGARKVVVSLIIQENMSRQQKLINQLPLQSYPDQQVKLHLPFLRGATATDSTMKKHYREVVSAATYQHAIEHASSVFKQTFADRQSQAVQENTEGICIFRGFVDFVGARGKYRVEVMAYYMPSTNAWVGQPRLIQHFIIPDFAGAPSQGVSERKTSAMRPQPHPATDQTTPLDQPSAPTEKPSPGKDAGK